MPVSNVQSVFFFVTDLERSKDYYQKVLDIEPIQQGPSMVAIPIGGVNLLLHADGDTVRVRPPSKRGAGVSLHIQVHDIQAVWERLRGLGISTEEAPTEQPYGFMEFAIKDPDGYEVEFVEPV